MKLKPDDKTFEGKLIQAFQGILLFEKGDGGLLSKQWPEGLRF